MRRRAAPSRTRRRAGEVVRVSYDRTPAVLGELVIVTCAFVLGRVLVGGLDVLDPGLWPEPGTVPAPAVVAFTIVVPAALALFGIHQIVTITVLLGPVLPGADGGRRPDTVPRRAGFLGDRLDDRAVRDIDRGGSVRSFTFG